MNLINDEHEIDLSELIKSIWVQKYFISFFLVIGLVLSSLYSLSLPNKYSSQALLSPSNPDSDFSSDLDSYSSFAGAAGISLTSNTKGDPSVEALERIKSFNFFTSQFLPYIKLENLLAVEEWVQESNTIVYDKKVYDEISNKWLKNYLYTKNQSPSEQEAFKEYKKILNISKDSKTQFITISITHNSPFLAKEWLEIIIKNINESMRESDKKLALSYIDFLNKSSQEAKVNGIKEGISQLLEVQMQKLMLTSANKNYIFKTIDSPIASEYKSSPNRLLIVIIGTIFIGLLGAVIALSIFFYRKKY